MKLKPRSADKPRSEEERKASKTYRDGYLAGIMAARESVQKLYDLNMIISRQIEKGFADEADDKPDIRAEQSP